MLLWTIQKEGIYETLVSHKTLKEVFCQIDL